MKAVSFILILLAVVALGIAGTLGARDLRGMSSFNSKLDRVEAERDSLIKAIGATNLEFRAFQKSIPTLPDTTKMNESGRIAERMRDFNKEIRTMEMRERDLGLDRHKFQRRRDEYAAHLRKWVATAGGSGVVLLLAGFVLRRRA